MQKIMEQLPPKHVLAIREVLSNLGFNITLLGGQKYVLNRLRSLSDEQLWNIRSVFMEVEDRKRRVFFTV